MMKRRMIHEIRMATTLRDAFPLIAAILFTAGHACGEDARTDPAHEDPALEAFSFAEFVTLPEMSPTAGNEIHAGLPRLALLQVGANGLDDPQTPNPASGAIVMSDDVFAPDRFGAKGSTRLDLRGGWGFDLADSHNQIYVASGGLSHFIEENLSISWTINGLYADQFGDDAVGFGVDLLLRWHFLTREQWTVFAEGGAGLLLTSDDVPEDGSSFNFTPQFGLGATYAISGQNRFVAGVRWHHISNANLFSDNPGRDAALLYLGLSMPF